jgi:hypothetical protein
MNPSPPADEADSPNGRSGCCYEETYPRMHALCPGRYDRRATPTASTQVRVCSCRCHTLGVEALGMPTLKKLQSELSRGFAAKTSRRLHGSWVRPQQPRALQAGGRPLQ